MAALTKRIEALSFLRHQSAADFEPGRAIGLKFWKRKHRAPERKHPATGFSDPVGKQVSLVVFVRGRLFA